MNPFVAFVFLLLFAGNALAQTNQIISPEISPDKKVVFRLAAPKAETVGLFVDWMKAGELAPMTRNSDGIWSVTLEPLKPGIYIYNFNLDGLNIADPVNPKMKLRARTSASLLEIPGDGSEFWELRDVQRGTVQINCHKAETLDGEIREVWVYTPPGYEKNRAHRYPALYLLHGSNDTPAGWTSVGRANVTMDNLLAAKRAREMIIVMPFGHAVPFGAPRGDRPGNGPRFKEYFLKEVMPMIESKYRVAPGRKNRAIAGFSMGGGHALEIGLSRLDLFSSIGAFSAAAPDDFETRFASVLQDPSATNHKLDLFWMACGREDFLFSASTRLDAALTAHGIRHTFTPTEGAHTYNVWRNNFIDFAPLLFQAKH